MMEAGAVQEPMENISLPSGDPVWDVVVVGGGPAGSMAAYELSRSGKRVLLLERRAFPRWKACGATLSPGIQDLLVRAGMGELLSEAGARPLHSLRVGGWSLRADLPLAGSMSLSRAVFDTALLERAVRAGARVQHGARARLGPLGEDRRVLRVTADGQESQLSARVVVAADGLTSGLLSQEGIPSAPLPSGGRPLVGLGGTFSSPPPRLEAGVVHMALGEEGYVGMVRVEDGSLNVAAALNPGALKEAGAPGRLVESILRRGGWPSLGADPDGGWQGTPELTRRPSMPGAERLFAVGDASGYVEPFTGEGMFWALSGARALAPLAGQVGEVWNPGLLAEWSRVHRRRIGRAQRLCRAVAWTLAKPTLTRSLLRAVRASPRMAEPVIRRVGVSLTTRA